MPGRPRNKSGVTNWVLGDGIVWVGLSLNKKAADRKVHRPICRPKWEAPYDAFMFDVTLPKVFLS